jgi:hypothetical protein
MRSSSAFVAAVLLVVACTHKPEEIARPDAGLPTTPPKLVIAGHSGDAAPPPEGDAGQTPTKRFCEGAYSADVDRMRDKCALADLTLSQSLAHAAANLCDHDLRVATERSRASFDPDAAGKCTEMLRDKALTQTSENDTLFGHFPCDRVLVGAQDEGKPCLFSVECKEGLACVGYAIGSEGTCKKPPKVKEACTLQPFGTIINEAAAAPHHPACAKGAYCDGKSCLPRVAAGKGCSASTSCADGLSCVQGKCGPRAAEGAPCGSATDCAFGLWCSPADAGAGRCASKRADGQPCSSEDACKGRCDIPKGTDGRPQAVGKCVAICGSG